MRITTAIVNYYVVVCLLREGPLGYEGTENRRLSQKMLIHYGGSKTLFGYPKAPKIEKIQDPSPALNTSWWTFRIFLFFLLGGRERGV